MKSIVAGLIFLVSPVLFATNPANFCLETNGCTPRMLELSEQYRSASYFPSEIIITSYSGACYHLSDQYDPQMEHHGAFSFENRDSEILIGGVFSFFAGANPYENLTALEVNYYLKKNSSDFKKGTLRNSALELIYIYPESTIGYWMRHTADGSLILIGKNAGPNYINLVFCNLSQHTEKN